MSKFWRWLFPYGGGATRIIETKGFKKIVNKLKKLFKRGDK